MGETLYGIDTGWIAGGLFAAMAGAIEAGHALGRRRAVATGEATREHINAIQSAMLGLLALLLGFTFSLALQRYDARSEAVVAEANAIGTAWLRTGLLAPAAGDEMRALLRRYVDARVDDGRLGVHDRAAREALAAETAALQSVLWQRAAAAVRAELPAPGPALHADAVNALIDRQGERSAALARHVPEPILWLVFATFAISGGIVGYAAGVAGHRPAAVTYVLVGLIVTLVFAILDLDRPGRGLIRVRQDAMLQLQAQVRLGTAEPVTLPAASGRAR